MQTTLHLLGPTATKPGDSRKLVSKAADYEDEARLLYSAAIAAALRSDYHEAGLLLARHSRRLDDAKALRHS